MALILNRNSSRTAASAYLQTSSNMSKEGRRYVRSTENLTESIAAMKTIISKKNFGRFRTKISRKLRETVVAGVGGMRGAPKIRRTAVGAQACQINML